MKRNCVACLFLVLVFGFLSACCCQQKKETTTATSYDYKASTGRSTEGTTGPRGGRGH